MRTKLWFVALLAPVAVSACSFDSDGGYRRRSDAEIVFAISQAKNADGKLTTSVGYELLDLGSKGWTARGVVTKDRSCWAEKLDDRLGQPKVEGGFATFEGGLLPQNGIAVVANRSEELTLDAPAWDVGGTALTFQARGFAMPDIPPTRLVVPSTTLAISQPAETGEIKVQPTPELEIAWTDADAKHSENVVAALQTTPADGSRGVELRCFFERRAGKGSFPKVIVDRFLSLAGDGEVKGTLSISTHRQLTIHADGGWKVYVVATVAQREQPFVMDR
ncbi:MAG: hypothetical protein KF819_28660 [Labilithrix sp.]|nr:hypothetical protein [Labilithrix sp.]